MPTPVQDVLSESKVAIQEFSLEPALNAVHSLMLMTMVEKRSGLAEWVVNTAESMSQEERDMHRLVIIGFYYLVNPDQSWPSFPDFVDHLAARDPIEMRDALIQSYADMAKKDHPAPDFETVLSSSENYIAFLSERFGEEHVEIELEKRAYEYVRQPEAMQDLIVSHLRKMWDGHLKEEWDRVRPMLEDSAAAFQQVDFTGMSKEEAVRLVAADGMDDKFWDWLMENTEKTTFVPSAHVGPYVGRYHSADQLWVIFGARVPEGVSVDAPDLSRADIGVRLNALADDDRLRILKHISVKGEQRSQEIMDELGFSQSASSRHLKQLSASGFLTERRCSGAKCYQLNPSRIEHTLEAVSKFLLAEAN
jgi:DNA-binding transcriptional ArsR family regulator